MTFVLKKKTVKECQDDFHKRQLVATGWLFTKDYLYWFVFVVVASLGCGSLCVVMLHSEDMHDDGCLLILTETRHLS